jgi:hypothetical protein
MLGSIRDTRLSSSPVEPTKLPRFAVRTVTCHPAAAKAFAVASARYTPLDRLGG